MNRQAAPAQNGRRALEVAIGRQIRTMRQSHEMTLSELSKVSGLSVGMISKIESGQTSASLASLQAIANVFNIPIAALFQTYDEKREATYVKSGEGLRIERRGSRAGHLYQLLGHSLRSAIQIEPYLITLSDDADAYPLFQHAGHEFIYMLKGDISYRHGSQVYRLNPGDSLFFDSGALHGPEELKKLPAIYLSVIVTLPKANES